MSRSVIELENVSKYYRLGTIGGKTINDDLQLLWAKLSGKENPLLEIGQKDHGNREGEFIWALRDINLKVDQGEILGIIGANGAGKSTLLKILSRITGPTSGKVKIKGRIGSLLEVGTGFHPELTGRENVYLNGAILGMRRYEIDKKFDEIVDFSGVEKYIDTPVKRYSSGMRVRLGFAVAAHLDPEILVVDEVLAVGDAEFQKKCLGKMSDVAGEGRTVIFVSHNMGAINSLCLSAILLENGTITAHGVTNEITNLYLMNKEVFGKVDRSQVQQPELTIKMMQIIQDGKVKTTLQNSKEASLVIECQVESPIQGAQIAYELMDPSGVVIYCSTNRDYDTDITVINPGTYTFTAPIMMDYLRDGRYSIKVTATVPKDRWLDNVEELLSFDVLDEVSPILKLGQNRKGMILPVLKWERK